MLQSSYTKKRIKPLAVFVASFMVVLLLIPKESLGMVSFWHIQEEQDQLSHRLVTNFQVPVDERLVNLNFEETPLREVLREFSQQAGIRFSIQTELAAEKRITYSCDNKKVLEALVDVLHGAGLIAEVSDNRKVVIIKEQSQPRETEQERVAGTVTDAETGEPLPGVNIAVQGTTTGTSTDADGNYELTVPSLNATLIFSNVGYQAQEIQIQGRVAIDVFLSMEEVLGEELIVVGYGVQRRANVTGAVHTVQGAELAEQPEIRTSSALMGKIPGVQVIQDSGQPGRNEGTIRIRGVGTLGDAGRSSPLILIDGVQGSLDNVASSDIESISVLKDAASAAIYGSRAANGVILVTTKRGQQERIQINYQGSIGFRTPTNQPEFVDAGTFMRLENLGATNVGSQPIWSESYMQEWSANHRTDPDNYPNTDWVDQVFSEPGFQQRQHLSISGGSEMIRYLGSLTYDEENGNIPNFSFQRYSLRFNTDVQANDRLSFRFDLNLQRNDQDEASAGLTSITWMAYRIPPIYPARYTNGGWGVGWNGTNPVASAQEGGVNFRETSLVDGRIEARYRFLEGLEVEFRYVPQYRSVFRRQTRTQYQVFDPNSGTLLHEVPARNSLFQQTARDFTHNVNLLAQYMTTIGDHHVNLLGGYEFRDFRYDNFSASRDQFELEDFMQLNAGSQENMSNAGYAYDNALQSVFGRINYDYRSKYLLEANLRYDGSSRFAEGNRWGVFPSFSAGWRISEESFMQPLHFLSELKVRGSWGQLGNQQIGNYPFASVINLGQDFIFGGSPASGAAQLDLANTNISWETTTTMGVGLDASFWNDRLTLTFDWFKRTTDDILLELPIPLIIGLNAPYQNAGEVENTGWELEVGYRNNVGTDFFYGVSFNVSDVRNKVIDLKGAGPFISGNTIIKEGYPIGSIHGFESDGLFQSQAEIDAHATQSGQIAPGDIRYVDQNGDGMINADDRVVIGDPFPSFNYGINLSANYKGLSISAFFQGVGSRDVLLRNDAVWALYNAGKIRTWQAEDFWTPENPNASMPRLTRASSHNNFEATDFWMYDGSYLRLRNLQVGYALPGHWTEALGVRNVRVFYVGQNLFTLFDNMPPGVDPNVPNNTPGDYYPVTMMNSVGIDIGF